MTMPIMTAERQRLRVELGARAYDIVVGAGLIATAGHEIRPLMRRPHAVVVSDDNVARHWLEPLLASLAAAGISYHTVVLPPGEETKDLAHFGRLAEDVLACGLERGSMLIALGGGVVGDITGFAAATLLRGVDFVQLPTTLLAQVDSSVGGKTAINAASGKNLIGAFYQPRLVVADTDVLATLPRRELLAGYGETVKYGLIRDAAFFAWCERQGNALCGLAPEPLRHAIVTSCQMKAEIVAGDEREEGERALLNFGHTFGHALEAETGYTRFLHGEAVAWGMKAAALLGEKEKMLPAGDKREILECVNSYGPFPALNGIDPSRLAGRLKSDKKTVQGKVHFVLPERIGVVKITADVQDGLVLAAIEEALAC